GCVLAGIVQAEIEIIAQGMIEAQVQTQPAALQLTSTHCQRYASGTDSAPRQPVAAQILTPRQTGPANPPALLPVPGRRQAPAKGQVATLLVRPGQAHAGALQRSTIQTHQSQAGKGLESEVAVIEGEAALAEQLPAVGSGVIAAAVQTMRAVQGAK